MQRPRRRPIASRTGIVLGCLAAALAAGWGVATLLQASAGEAVAPLREEHCRPLHVVDRNGRSLRELPAACGHRGRTPWVRLSQVPSLLQATVLVEEDRRFYSHPGVDLWAVGRAAMDNACAGRVVSGASTVTMQLMRMLHHPRGPRSLGNKLREAWLSLAAERRLTKAQILEAYLNHAYYGRGAYGVAEAARRYFGKAPAALTDSEALLLALLPRAPTGYDPALHPERARMRYQSVRATLLAHRTPHRASRALPDTHDAAPPSGQPAHFAAPHFVDWVLGRLPPPERRAGGVLETTLDLHLQTQLERATARHVAARSRDGITHAAVVVLDTHTSEVLAMVGSAGYDRSQLNLTVRRRHPGSLLKPFVYALSIERGANPAGLVYDVGDVPSAARARDWVGREGGPLPMAEALAGSYNLAALHALEDAGVEALHARLQAMGVADAPKAPSAYGLDLALGATRVRLLDVTAGFGFLVRNGRVREPRGIRRLARSHAGSLASETFRLPPATDRPGFSPEVSWLVMDMLSNPAARHRRFGHGLPPEGAAPQDPGARVVAKTGTASGMADFTTVVASREFLVGVWAGRLDGRPAQGMSGMWAAAPLARLALDIALAGKAPSLPPRPAGLLLRTVCAISGMAATDACPQHTQRYGLADAPRTAPCTWHQRDGRGIAFRPPAVLHDWMGRADAQPRR